MNRGLFQGKPDFAAIDGNEGAFDRWNGMYRLFVAIRPPPVIRKQLMALMVGGGSVRWQSDDQLHITLRFVGDVDQHVARDVADALSSVRQPPFQASLNDIGTFGRRGRHDTLWVGIAPREPLTALHQKIDQACIRAGLQSERRAYHPHVTLARLKRTSGSIEAFVNASADITSPPFEVASFALFESQLTPEGAVYTIIERYSLA